MTTPNDTIIRPLGPDDADAFFALRREALLDTPLAFGSSPEDDRISSPEAARAQLSQGAASVVFGAMRGGLVGMVGVVRDHHRKAAHRAMIWGMFVRPAHRGAGVGRALLDAAIAHAATLDGVRWIDLGVSAANPGARRLYERAGFVVWGTEPEATMYDGMLVDEHHMTRRA